MRLPGSHFAWHERYSGLFAACDAAPSSRAAAVFGTALAPFQWTLASTCRFKADGKTWLCLDLEKEGDPTHHHAVPPKKASQAFVEDPLWKKGCSLGFHINLQHTMDVETIEPDLWLLEWALLETWLRWLTRISSEVGKQLQLDAFPAFAGSCRGTSFDSWCCQLLGSFTNQHQTRFREQNSDVC